MGYLRTKKCSTACDYIHGLTWFTRFAKIMPTVQIFRSVARSRALFLPQLYGPISQLQALTELTESPLSVYGSRGVDLPSHAKVRDL